MELTNYYETLILFVVISSFSITQTLFGVGLLVFGTPTLLLLGYPFTTALFLLLPASVLLSAIQIIEGKNQIAVVKEFIYFSIPPMLLGLFIVSAGFINLNLKLIIGLILIFISILKKLEKYNKVLLEKFSKNIKLYMTFMGAIHGISNQGGGLLTLYFSTIYGNKLKIRSNIAFCYFVYGISQLLFLVLFHYEQVVLMGLMFSGVSVLIYFTVGGKIFHHTSEKLFHNLISIAIIIFGLTLIYGGLF
jgi:uncharacterized membrane protein YfcA